MHLITLPAVHRQPIFSNTGIILFKTLCVTFPKLNVEMIVQLLQSMEICQQVHSSILQDSNLKALPSSSPDELVFFPGQIKERRPEHVFSPKFGWYLECSDPHQFFTCMFFFSDLHLHFLWLARTIHPPPLYVYINFSEGVRYVEMESAGIVFLECPQL